MKIGMIGMGHIAQKAYLPVLAKTKGIELHICTRNKDTLNEIGAMYKIQNLYSDLTQWIKSGITAAFVHSSTESHEEIVDMLLDHGIHVYVDKPITDNIESTERLIEKAKQKELILMVGFNRRHAPSYKKLEELKDPNMMIMQKNVSKSVGNIRSFIFNDFIHIIDTLLHLFTYEIKNIHVHGKVIENQLHHVSLQLEADEGTAIGIMNRNAGNSVEKVEVMNAKETRMALNVNDVTSHINKQIYTEKRDDWAPTLKKRGFQATIDLFLNHVSSGFDNYNGYKKDLESHVIAEKIIQLLIK